MTRTVKYKQSPTPPIDSVTYESSTWGGKNHLILCAGGRLVVRNSDRGTAAGLSVDLSREDLQSLSEDIITILMQTEGES